MKPSKTLLVVFLLLFVAAQNLIYCQKIVDVDLLTGAANVTIPISVVQKGDIAVPIVLSYRAGGVKVEDYDQQVGLGWKINLDASVTRVLRGFPDDIQYQGNSGYSIIKGWLKTTTIPSLVENFTISNDNNATTCTDEVSDYSYMNSNFSDNYDTEPDQFMVNAPGLNLQFVFDKNQNIKVISFQDVQITKTADPTTGALTSFTVINDKGIKYVFDKTASISQHIDDIITPSTLPAFKRNYIFSRHGQYDPWLSYAYKWYLTSITDTKGNQVTYTYDATQSGPVPKANEKVEIIKYNPSTSLYEKQYLYTNIKYTSSQRVSNIYMITAGSDPIFPIHFSWDGNYSESKLTSISLSKEGLIVTPSYTIKFNKDNNQNVWGRYFLKALTFSRAAGGDLSRYKFSYNNVTEVYYADGQQVNISASTSYCTPVDSITNAQDYWGFYNGYTANPNLFPTIWVYPDNSNVSKFKTYPIPSYSGNVIQLTGASTNTYRDVNANTVAGTLSEIDYPNGGVTRFDYANNDYFDNDVNGAAQGGGVRVTKITNNDGLNTNEVTYYDYNDPSTNITSGRAISLPCFGFAFPNSNGYSTLADEVKNSTYRTPYSFSDEDAEIIYGKVTVRKTSGGKTIYDFNTAGTWKSSSQNEWYETPVYITRNYTSNPSPCNAVAPDFLTNGAYNYPFPSNPNYDFERGLLTKITNYNESGNIVSEETYSYSRSHAASTKIVALKFDDIGNVRGYAKYDVVSTITNLLASKISKIYTTKSPYDANAYTTETETYTYPTSGEHRLPIVIQKTNSDGNAYTTRIKYAKDYTTTGSGDVYEQGINGLKTKNNNARIEMYQSATPSGGTEKMIGGDIITYKAFYNSATSQNMYLPYESYKFVRQAGVTDFSASTITSGNFSKYSAYYKTGTILSYDFAGNSISATDNSRINKTVLIEPDNDMKLAEFVNAKSEEVIYNSFDYGDYIYGSTITNGSSVSGGRSNGSCLSMQTNTSLTKSVSIATTNTNMIFSCWIKDAASAGTLIINLSATGFSANYTISFATGTDWKYYEVKIPKPSQTSVTVTVTTNAALKIDDALFYPGNALAKTYSYSHLNYGSVGNIILTSETGMGGSVRYFDYDALGRPLSVKDVDNNIREMKMYRYANSWPSALTQVSITSYPQTVYKDVAETFTAYESPTIPYGTPGVQYTWNFGDGTIETLTTGSRAHTYTATGYYTVTCTVSAPLLGSVTSSNYSVSVFNQPPPPVTPYICAAGIVELTTNGTCIQSSCTGLTSSCSNTKFKITSIGGGSLDDIESATWQKAPVGTEDWTNAGFGTQITITFDIHTTSYKVRCTVLMMSNGATGTSGYLTVLKD